MSSSRRLLVGAAVLFSAVLAALPFKKHLLDQQGQRDERRSRVRWRQAQASVPTPLEVHEGESPAKDLHASVGTRQHSGNDESANRVGHAVTIHDKSRPPRIPAAYQPLLQPKPTTSVQASLKEEGSAPDSSRAASSDSTRPSNDSSVQTARKVIRHRIRDGDTLQALAARYLGDPGRYREIYERNQDRLPSEEVLPLNLMIEIYVPR